ncbi:hypothetical protein [Variovorax saccharolyticus]|uniref:hypothetical protein n=1 Tax=Variovorax saccharolyticus TaxID=3053516 RepID=UPI0025770FC6|nr:hypothetical protein [Variovorax sp. J31P216]MDM0030169.1 hypothetical protein [Variovorax sp. J31P216]
MSIDRTVTRLRRDGGDTPSGGSVDRTAAKKFAIHFTRLRSDGRIEQIASDGHREWRSSSSAPAQPTAAASPTEASQGRSTSAGWPLTPGAPPLPRRREDAAVAETVPEGRRRGPLPHAERSESRGEAARESSTRPGDSNKAHSRSGDDAAARTTQIAEGGVGAVRPASTPSGGAPAPVASPDPQEGERTNRTEPADRLTSLIELVTQVIDSREAQRAPPSGGLFAKLSVSVQRVDAQVHIELKTSSAEEYHWLLRHLEAVEAALQTPHGPCHCSLRLTSTRDDGGRR